MLRPRSTPTAHQIGGHHYFFPKRRSRLYQVVGDTIDYAPNLSPEGYCGWVDSEGSALIEAKENDFKVQVNFNEAPGYDASMTGDTIRCRSAGNSAVNCVSKSRGAVWEPHFHLAPSSKPWQTTFVLE